MNRLKAIIRLLYAPTFVCFIQNGKTYTPFCRIQSFDQGKAICSAALMYMHQESDLYDAKQMEKLYCDAVQVLNTDKKAH